MKDMSNSDYLPMDMGSEAKTPDYVNCGPFDKTSSLKREKTEGVTDNNGINWMMIMVSTFR